MDSIIFLNFNFYDFSNIFSYRVSVAILRMPHGLDYSFVLSKANGVNGKVNAAFTTDDDESGNEISYSNSASGNKIKLKPYN